MLINVVIIYWLSSQTVIGNRHDLECGVDPVERLFGDESAERQLEVVGGLPANRSLPWLVRLQIQKHLESGDVEYQYCAGSLVDEWHVLTAGHCMAWHPNKNMIADKDKWKAGRVVIWFNIDQLSDGQMDDTTNHTEDRDTMIIYSNNIVYHEDFQKSADFQHDIALLLLKWPITFGVGDYKLMNRLCLPDNHIEKKELDFTNCTVSGWGSTSPNISRMQPADHLRSASMSIAGFGIEMDNCIDFFKAAKVATIDRRFQVCGVGQPFNDNGDAASPCKMDSGGPIVCRSTRNGRYFIEGVGSFGGCGWLGMPAVFTRVSEYREWIEQKKRLFDKRKKAMSRLVDENGDQPEVIKNIENSSETEETTSNPVEMTTKENIIQEPTTDGRNEESTEISSPAPKDNKSNLKFWVDPKKIKPGKVGAFVG